MHVHRWNPVPAFKQVKKLGDFGSVQVSCKSSVGCTRLETYRKIRDCFKCVCDSFAVSWCPGGSRLCQEVRDRLIDVTPQQDIAWHLWNALRSVIKAPTSTTHYQPLASLTENARSHVRLWCQAAREAHTQVAPVLLSAQPSLIPRIICSLLIFFFLSVWMFSECIHLSLQFSTLHFRLQWLRVCRREVCSNTSRTTPQNFVLLP